MLNTQKLLYILPDVTYVAELLPTKKEHTFAVQTFRQINGEFLDDENLIPENIEKLFSKIEAETYHLILPDFLFTNTIVEVKETSENKVKTYIKDELLPNLGISKETHEIETFILTQYNGVSKVQLTALERSVLDPIISSAKTQKVEITAISPLSWTIKSIVSLEPSITAIQIGKRLYLAEHYIGVDQCTDTTIEELDSAIETIKTLKGSQPSIQTIYLLTNELVEESLKENVSSTLPIQQLASFKETDTQMPSYVKQIIESGMKTIDISDYPVPKFALPKQTSGLPLIRTQKDDDHTEAAPAVIDAPKPAAIAKPEPETKTAEPIKEIEKPVEDAPKDTSETETEKEKTNDQAASGPQLPLLPPVAPTAVVPAAAAMTAPVLVPPTRIDVHDVESDLPEPKTDSSSMKEKDVVKPVDDLHQTDKDSDTVVVTSVPPFKLSEPFLTKTETKPVATDGEAAKVDVETAVPHATPKIEPVIDLNQHSSQTVAPALKAEEPDLRQFASISSMGAATSTNPVKSISTESVFPTNTTPLTTSHSNKTPLIIKNKSGTGSMLKMIFITLAVFCATVAVGVGIGLGVLSFTNKSNQGAVATPSPVAVATTAPITNPSPSPTTDSTASASTTASSSATLSPSKLSILVVNATTTPGYAGTTKSKLDKAGYKSVKAANAKGDYTDGTYVLMKTQDPDLIAQLEKDTGLTLKFATGYATEDTAGTYNAVIVLAQ